MEKPCARCHAEPKVHGQTYCRSCARAYQKAYRRRLRLDQLGLAVAGAAAVQAAYARGFGDACQRQTLRLEGLTFATTSFHG